MVIYNTGFIKKKKKKIESVHSNYVGCGMSASNQKQLTLYLSTKLFSTCKHVHAIQTVEKPFHEMLYCDCVVICILLSNPIYSFAYG